MIWFIKNQWSTLALPGRELVECQTAKSTVTHLLETPCLPLGFQCLHEKLLNVKNQFFDVVAVLQQVQRPASD